MCKLFCSKNNDNNDTDFNTFYAASPKLVLKICSIIVNVTSYTYS